MSESKERNVCNTCNSGFLCGRLSSALEVLELQLQKLDNPTLDRELQRIKTKLGTDGWAYPDGKKMCVHGEDPKVVSQMTNHLLHLLYLANKSPAGQLPDETEKGA